MLIFTSNSKPKSRICQGLTARDTHLKDLHEGEKTVLKRPLVVTVENKRLQHLQNSKHVAEEDHVVLLPELMQVEVDSTVQKTCDHRQMPGGGGGDRVQLCYREKPVGRQQIIDFT